ncbi:MAG: hypothetical protein LBB58_02465, partial [Cellulomonadaceae bacterium]|nr:hypothetical protein [Cellulomonadaceae bacterium]
MYRIFGKPRSFTCAAISAVVVFGLTGCAASSQLALTAKGDDGTLVADPGLQECLKANKIETAADAAKATKMDCFDYKIKDLTGIEQLTHLTYLDMDMNEFSDLTPLSTLTKLEHLCLMGSRISDVSALSGLVNLKELDLDETAVADLTPLKALSKLETLYARNTKVADVTPLAGLKHLKQVYLNGSEVRSVAPLKPQIKNGAHVLYDW